jgi:hypothetical protein
MTPIETAMFWSRVEAKELFQCWEWKGAKIPKGYGRLMVGGQRKMAHRVAYEFFHGAIPEDLLLRHTCDNPACCNPNHLVPGNNQDNMDDMVSRERSMRGSKNAKTKLTDEEALYIRRNPDKLTINALAAKFGIAKSTVSYIRSGRSWKYLVAGAGFEPATPAM